ncbi:MAG: hypothetical protein KAJ14_13700 [Candidatus Omnitrophica bacterium]|nr:hypothetical protein [Candidatus Omnitrophota bacterium]MCK5393296.1 hypothetical protein [Candidatus Omnitrophota bacterium]MCK5494160.1 hypothetical protein [Candidatus Omnitrophota bacterium]
MKKKYFLIYILVTTVIFAKIVINNIYTYPQFDDEPLYLKDAAQGFKLKFKEGKSLEEIGKKLFFDPNIEMDMPIIMEYILGTGMYLKYNEDFLRLAEIPIWDGTLSYDENIERGVKVSPKILYFGRHFSLIAGIISYLVLCLILWSIGIKIGILIVSILFISNPLFQLGSSFIVTEMFLILFSCLGVLSIFEFYNGFVSNNRRSIAFAFLTAVLLTFALLVKFTAAILISYFLVLLITLHILNNKFGFLNKTKILVISLCVYCGTFFFVSYFLHPFIRIYPVTGWLKLIAGQLASMENQGFNLCKGWDMTVMDRMIVVPHRILYWAKPSTNVIKIMYLFLITGSFMFFGKLLKRFRKSELASKHKNSNKRMRFIGIWVLIVGLLIIFLNYDWGKYYPVSFKKSYLFDVSEERTGMWLKIWDSNKKYPNDDFRNYEGDTNSKPVNLPNKKFYWPIPFAKLSNALYLFVIVLNIIFLIGIIKGLKSFKFLGNDKKLGKLFIITSLWIYTCILQIIAQHSDQTRYYLVGIYLYYIIVGIGISELEKIYRKL